MSLKVYKLTKENLIDDYYRYIIITPDDYKASDDLSKGLQRGWELTNPHIGTVLEKSYRFLTEVQDFTEITQNIPEEFI